MKHFLFILFVLALVNACLSPNTGTVKPPSNGESSEPINRNRGLEEFPFDSGKHLSSQLTLDNQNPAPLFEEELLKRMKKPLPEIKVALTESIEPKEEGEIPEQLYKWLDAVTNTGGKIEYEPISGDMGIGTTLALLTFAFKTYDYLRQKYLEQKQREREQLAKNYHVRFCYRRDDNLVTKVVFLDRRQPDKQACTY